jgi:hypothetical protein
MNIKHQIYRFVQSALNKMQLFLMFFLKNEKQK